MGPTAAEWLATAPETEIREVIRTYGEERFAKPIAAAIIAARARGPLGTTRELAALVAEAVPTREPHQDPATRTFQALRIRINQELEELTLALPQCVELLEPGGRLVVISFHSLEDRIVKRFMREHSQRTRCRRSSPVRARDLPPPKLTPRRQGSPPELDRDRGESSRPQRDHARGGEDGRSSRVTGTKWPGRRTAPRPSRYRRTRIAFVRGGMMTKANLVLLPLLIACALALVTAQHQARKLYVELQKQQELAKHVRRRVGTASARAKHLGNARAYREDRSERTPHAYALGVPDAAGVDSRTGRSVNAAACPALALKFQTWRSRLMLLVLLAWFLALAARALYLQGLHNDFLQAKGESRYSRSMSLMATRGMIVDRNNEPLAISTPVESVAASPADINLSSEQAAKLARLLQIDTPELKRRLADTKREFVYLKRQLPPEQAAKIVELNVPGLFLQREYRRYYPAGEVTAHLIGFTDVDDKGQEALELAFEQRLAGKPGSRRVIKDRRGHIIEDIESIREPQHGEKLTLSIDARIQYLAFRELKKAVTEHRAKAGGIVVLDAQTGEVLAMANLPIVQPEQPRQARSAPHPQSRGDRSFRTGLDAEAFHHWRSHSRRASVKPDTVIQTSPGYLSIGNRTIHDAHAQGALTVAQVIQKSSNVGAAKIALSLPAESMWTLFKEVGFGTPPDSGFPGEVSGRLRAYGTWKPIEQATMAYGHGISVSLLQLARAYTIFAKDGELAPLTLLKRDTPPELTRVLKPKTARAVRAMLEMVVQPGGTAPRAQIAGYRVAGKTGTAHKLDGHHYTNKYISSFVGFAPASNPRLIVAVMIDEASAGQYYGGSIAAPVFAAVMSGALRLLAVPPDAPVNNVVLPPPSAPEIKEEV